MQARNTDLSEKLPQENGECLHAEREVGGGRRAGKLVSGYVVHAASLCDTDCMKSGLNEILDILNQDCWEK
jgi:hypothetical protein